MYDLESMIKNHRALRRQRQRQKGEICLAEGLVVTDTFAQKREDRRLTLLWKAALVYLTVMGGMGSFLSSVEVDVSWTILHAAVLFSALYCAFLYYSRRWQNVGYLLLLAGMAAGGYWLGKYINSGFYAVANDLSEQVSVFFDSNAMRSYGEQIGNRTLAITIAMSYIGWVCCILMNIAISRKMRWFSVVFWNACALGFPMYLDLTPSFLYVAMLFSGCLCCFMIRGSGHYQLSYENNMYQWNWGYRRVAYVYRAGIMARTIAVVVLLSVLGFGVVSVIYPASLHKQLWGVSEVKEKSMDTVENVSMLGLLGLFNFYPNTGGLTNGTLGGVNAIRYDYETDLTMTFAPYTQDRIYFKNFTGCTYLAYTNRWSKKTDAAGTQVEEEPDVTTRRWKRVFSKQKDQALRGSVLIENVAAAIGPYLPYYSMETTQTVAPGEQKKYDFYHGTQEGLNLHFTEKEIQQETDGWLEVPEENREAIAQLCADAGLSAQDTVQQNVQRLAQYFQENIPYSYRPGATPYREDFVNYFLQKNKRGYCAHFASAAVLAFRYIGIPARYAEGYAVDPEDISEEGTIQYDEKYENYISGETALGETAVVSVNVTDANAHAWAEVFDPQAGWQVADETPASAESETNNGLWQQILNFLGVGNTDDSTREDASQEDSQTDGGDEKTKGLAKRTLLLLLTGAAVVMVVLVFGPWLLEEVLWRMHFRRSSWNDRLVMQYQKYISRITARERALANKKNYEDQLKWLSGNGYWRADVVRWDEALSILERAGFAKEQLTQEEYRMVTSCFVRRKQK